MRPGMLHSGSVMMRVFINLAGAAGNYEDFVDALEGCDLNDLSTPDGVNYRDPKVNTLEINSDCYFGV
jgi:hypothetical protein